MWLRYTTGARTELIGLEYFRAKFKQIRNAWAQTTVTEAMIFVAWSSAHLFRLIAILRYMGCAGCMELMHTSVSQRNQTDCKNNVIYPVSPALSGLRELPY